MSTQSSAAVLTSEFLKVARVGLANASAAIETLVSNNLTMDVLWAGSMPTSRFGEVSGHPDDLVIGAYVGVTGNVPGHALLVFSQDDALLLADLVLGQPVGTTTVMGDMEQSIIQEIANVLTSSYLTAIADHYHFALLPEPPLIAVDMAAAIIDNVLATSGSFEPETLSIVTQFRIQEETLNGFFLYIPEAISQGESEAA